MHMAGSTSPLADLPPNLLGHVIALLPLPADRARFRAVCRSWRSAMHHHVDTPQLPWIVHSDGTFVTLPNYYLHRWSPFPENTKLIGATGSWLAVYHADANGGLRSYMLHNPFSNTTVSLSGLDSVIGRVPDEFKVRKVLMRSTQDGLVAVTTNMRDCRIILCRPGKSGTWLLKRRALPYARICDIAFLEGSLYGVTSDEQLIELEIGQREDGCPMVRSAKYVIKHFLGHDEGGEQEDDEDESEVSGSEDDEVVEPSEASSLGGEEASEYKETSSLGGEEASEYKETSSDDDDDDDDDDDMESSETSSIEDADENTESTSDKESDDDNEVVNNLEDIDLDGYWSNPDDVEENEFMDYTVTERYLLESGGKQLMIRRRHFIPSHSTRLGREFITDSEVDDDSDVDILEADLHVGSWVPAVTTCTLFIGDDFSKSIHGCEEASEEFDYYFIDEHDVTITRATTFPEFLDWKSMWFSPPDIVV